MLRLGRLRAAGENGGEERGNGDRKEARGSGHLLSEREGEKRGSWERGGFGSACGSTAAGKGEREQGRAVGDDGADRWAPSVGERERELASWASAQEKKKGAQGWAGPAGREGGEQDFSLFFSN